MYFAHFYILYDSRSSSYLWRLRGHAAEEIIYSSSQSDSFPSFIYSHSQKEKSSSSRAKPKVQRVQSRLKKPLTIIHLFQISRDFHPQHYSCSTKDVKHQLELSPDSIGNYYYWTNFHHDPSSSQLRLVSGRLLLFLHKKNGFLSSLLLYSCFDFLPLLIHVLRVRWTKTTWCENFYFLPATDSSFFSPFQTSHCCPLMVGYTNRERESFTSSSCIHSIIE